jgi:serine/threonine-protein kinase
VLGDLEPRIADLKCGARAGGYVLEGELARGGFGVVYRAHHHASAAPAAVKVLHVGRAGEASAVARFDREAEVVLSLAHPHLVEIFEHGRLAEDGRPFFAMELLRGVTLGEHLAARGRVPVDEALAILDPLAAALDAAHARGIIHRDLKPSNVFLAEDRPRGRVVLLDFGIAKLQGDLLGRLTGSREMLGTVAYTAPEQFHAAAVDARADVYALGALAYALLTGGPPFSGSVGRVLREIRQSARPLDPSAAAPIDPALDAPLLRALERDVARRTPAAGAFVAALRDAAGAAGARVANAPPAGAVEQPALAIHAEARRVRDDEDDAWRGDLEAALPLVAAECAAAGLVAVIETDTKLLLVDTRPGDEARRRFVIGAAVRAYRRFAATLGARGRVTLALAIHSGVILMSPEGTLQGGGLLDVAAWVPPVPAGVVASRVAVAGLGMGGSAVPGAEGFVWMAR